MPHDKNGELLQVGDFVDIRCVVKTIVMQDDYCNLTVDTQDPMPPYTTPNTIVLNAKQVTLVKQ